MHTLFWLFALFGFAMSALITPLLFTTAASAPQEAVAAALGVALAVVPYCGARAFDELTNYHVKQSRIEATE